MCWRDDFRCWGKAIPAPVPVPLVEDPPPARERRVKAKKSGLGIYERIGWLLEGCPPDPVREHDPSPPPVALKPRRRKRGGPGLAAWARAVKERDGECVVCGSVENLHAHHIKAKSEYPDLALDLLNGETRCQPCHRLAHPELPSSLFAIAA